MTDRLVIEEFIENNKQIIKFNGIIDEDVDFDIIKVSDQDTIVFDFELCRGINSCGIREWRNFIDTFPDEKNVVYENCSTFIIEQINMVAGFFKAGSKIHSFYSPYFCEECDKEYKLKLHLNEISDGKAPVKTCDICQSEMEFDAIEEQYFQFLNY